MIRAHLPICLLSIGLLASMVSGEAAAQMFGARSLGQSLNRRAPPGVRSVDQAADATSVAGQVTGRERFLRGNRSRLDFVGRDLRELQRFVGQSQGSVAGTVVPAAADNIPRRRPRNANLLSPRAGRSATSLYEPRLVLKFDYVEQPELSTATRISDVLQEVPQLQQKGPLSIDVQDRIAILRGVVASEDDRLLAEALVELEPGVSQVVNELKIAE